MEMKYRKIRIIRIYPKWWGVIRAIRVSLTSRFNSYDGEPYHVSIG